MEEVPPHAHCKVCGKAVSQGDLTCGKTCASKRAEVMRQKQLFTYLLYGIAFFLILVLALAYRL